ncbi:recombinase family protein [Streptomyces phytophilus]|uniref:recombinase family protein n=1 Tax=Streptomyces phytophilus TaxID=722715 RepID=UPI0015F0595B
MASATDVVRAVTDDQAVLRAAIYARVSTEEQTRGYGIDVQVESCTEYCERKGWTIYDVYRDEGVSGSLTRRPALDRLMADARAGKIDVVVVHRYNRIGRVGRAFWRYIWALEDLEVGFTAATQEIIDTTTPAGIAQLQMYATFAEMDYNTIRDQLQDGIQAKAAQGGWPGGQPPYGYRIVGAGKPGSHLAIDDHEAMVLRTAWNRIVQENMNVRQAAARLNAMELYTRSGVPWSHSNLRNKLISESTVSARVIFRNPKRSHAGRGVILKKDGTPKYGKTTIISLEPIFTPGEVAALKRALTGSRRPKAPDASYPLSKRLFGACGSHHSGVKKTARTGRWYKCSGKNPKYPGAPVCTCPQVDAASVEHAVWSEVVTLLGDPERLQALAADWIGMNEGGQAQHAERLANLDRKITDRETALTTTVTEYARAGLPAVAVQAATRALTEELDQLKAMRDEAAAWQAESQAAELRARDLQALADRARERLHDMTTREQTEILALLDVRVTITGPVPQPRLGRACSLRQWFIDNDRLVPDELTDEQWARVEPIVQAWEPPHHKLMPGRLVVDALLHKARTGDRWFELPPRFGKGSSIHCRFKKWLADGTWSAIMRELPDSGRPVWSANLLPPLQVEGKVDPRLLITQTQAELDTRETGVPGPVTSGLSAGVHELLRGEAQLVTEAAEVVELVGRIGADLAPARRGPVVPRDLLPPATARVLEALPGRGTAQPEQIAQEAGTERDEALGRLHELQSLGFVTRDGTGWRLAPRSSEHPKR